MKSELHIEAIALAKRGVSVFPCQPRGKAPATATGLKQATTDTAIIDRWWCDAPDLNIGLACGAVAGFFVVDVDGERGEENLRKLEEQNRELPETIEAITGNGRHLYFRLGEHGPVRNTASKIGAGIDTRGDGGYVLAPPSIHPSGRRYEWSVDSAGAFADAPDWLHECLFEAADAKGKPLEHWHQVLTERIPNGARNNTLASIAGKLLFHDVNLIMIRDLLLAVNVARCDPPLKTTEIESIVASVARTHLRGRQ